ncbi:porin family protein [Capnocytophaga sp.]|uniref:porin family protein n=1 Tax=Capnocytophaga sp. TaxID=44737 RepID=UPI0026DA9FBB|nr:porin family protein [Capnocytophaga sp.]MDO5106118.1 porin family protein [Capnocytophaga sp.]
MKKFLTMATVIVASIFTAQAQEIKFGARAGVNFSTVSDKESAYDEYSSLNAEVETGFKTGFHIGAFAEFGLSDRFFIEAGLAYSQQGATLKSVKGEVKNSRGTTTRIINRTFDNDSHLTFGLINLPVWVKYDIEGFRPKIGMNFGYLTFAKSKIDGETYSEDVNKKFDFGLGIGAEYNLPMGLFFDANFNFGLTNLAQSEGKIIKNRVIQIGVGYKF